MTETIRREIMPDVRLTCYRTDKFRTGSLSVLLMSELKRETAEKNALLPHVLRRGTAEYPDLPALDRALDNLYGAEIRPVVMKWGEMQGVGFAAEFADDAFLPGEKSLPEKMIRLVGSMLLEPVTRGGMLLADYVESEREKLADEIASAVNGKMGYALKSLRGKMCQGERYAVDRLGEESRMRAVGYQGLSKHYRRLLSQARVEICFCGSAEFSRVARAVTEVFASMPRGGGEAMRPTQILPTPKKQELRRFEETMDVTQGKLVMGFRLGSAMEHPDYPVISVFQTMFGGSSSSMLFRSLRQEKQLCYAVHSQADRHKGVMFVCAGIDADRAEEAADAVHGELSRAAEGDFTPEELESAKRELVNAYRSAGDDPWSLCSLGMEFAFLGLACTPEEYAGLVDCVTKEQVAAFAAGIREDARFLLRGGEETA